MPLTIFRDVVTCGSWRFNDPDALPSGVLELGINILDGWDDTAPVDVQVSSRGNRDGDVPSGHFPLRSRHLTLAGWMLCTTRTAALQAFTLMCREAFPSNADLTLSRVEPDATKQLTVRRAGAIERPTSTNMTGPEFRFVVPLQAFDPLKYAMTPDISATTGVSGASVGGVVVPVLVPAMFAGASGQGNMITVSNVGSYDTRPLTTITGPLPAGWRWGNDTTGAQLLLDVDLGTADSLELDHRTESVRLNGYTVAPTLTGDWWTLVPGVNVLRLFGDYSAAATVTVTGRSAWE